MRPGARVLIGALRTGDVSCRDAVEASFEGLDVAAGFGGVAWRDDDAVRARAAEIDATYVAGGPIGTLHGLPVTVKDWIDVIGFPCAAGSRTHADRRPTRDATVAARLKAAGAVIVAKTTAGPVTELHGVPRHPLDTRRTPGYSSAGEAIAVATAASVVGIGSDSGGSIRFPAHCCGVVGFRPTFGRVPVTGHFPRVGPLGDARTVIGPLARTVDDMCLVLSVIAGPDGRDPSSPPVGPVVEPVVSRARVALHRRGLADAVDLDPDVASTVDRVAAALEAHGCIVTEADVFDVDHVLDITRRYWSRATLAAGEVERLLADWDRSRIGAMRLLERYDAILSPVAPYPAPAVGGGTDADWTYTLAPSLWGWPALAVPAGMSADGLPIGVQVVAGPWNDGLCCALGRLVEATRPST